MDDRFLHERAEQLAIMYLTRSPRLVVQKNVLADSRIDLLVEVGGHGRMLGVCVGGAMSVQRLGRSESSGLRISSVWKTKFEGWRKPSSDLPFPLLAIVFVMSGDDGYFGWLRQPLVRKGVPTLVSAKVDVVARWTVTSLADIVAAVEKWYDAKRPSSGDP